MALSGKDVREVSFTYRHRGYSMDAVDEFLDHVADRMEELERQVQAAQDLARQAEDRLAGKGGDDIIQRTLVHAQRTADDVVASAKASAEETVRKAHEKAKNIVEAGQAELAATLRRLESQKDRLSAQVRELQSHVEMERKRAIEFHTASLEWLSSVTPAKAGDSQPDSSKRPRGKGGETPSDGDEEEVITAKPTPPRYGKDDMDVTRAVPVVRLEGAGDGEEGAEQEANAPYDVDADSDATQAVSVVQLDNDEEGGEAKEPKKAGSDADKATQAIRLR